MWIPQFVELTNFISHQKTRLEFQEGSCLMLSGLNEDDPSQESNGSGKSGIVESVAFVLTGECFRNISSVDELIMDGHNFATVTMQLINAAFDKVLYIERTIYLSRHKPSKLNVTINGEIPAYIVQANERVDVRDGNRAILHELGISKEDLFNYFVISKKKHVNFFDMTDGEMKKVISRFSNATLIDGVNHFIDADINECHTDIREIELERSRLDGQEEVYDKQLEELQKPIDNTQAINELQAECKHYQELLVESQERTQQIESDIVACNADLENRSNYSLVDQDTINELNRDLAQTTQQMLNIEGDIARIKSQQNKLNAFLAGVIVCPHCQESFNHTHKEVSVSEMQQKFEVYKQALQTRNEAYERCKSIQHTDQMELKQYQQKQTEYNSTIASIKRNIRELEHNVKSEYDKIQQINNRIVQKHDEIADLQNQKPPTDKIAELKQKKKDISRHRRKLTKSEEQIQQKLQQVESWVIKFKEFRTHLANKSIGAIESYTNLYLQKLQSHITISIDGISMTKAGKIKNKINVQICKSGELNGSYGKLSEGEAVRVNVCNILAKQRLINSNSTSGGLDLLLLDEIIESVDSIGVYLVAKALNQLNQTIMIITHATNSRPVDNILQVVKRNGVSELQTQLSHEYTSN